MCKENFIFISYAHKDSAQVMTVIEHLRKSGFEVWYDNGIEAGSEWPEYIAEKLLGCEIVLVFLSASAVESHNCRREINFAIESKKELLTVHLEELELTPGMRLQLGTNQAIFRSSFTDDESFFRGISEAKILQKCRKAAEEQTEAESAPEGKPCENVCVAVSGADEGISKAEKAVIYAEESRTEKSAFHLKLKKDLKEKQLRNAISSYAHHISDEDVIAVMDITVTDSGKKGFLVTADALFCSEKRYCSTVPFSGLKAVVKSEKRKDHLAFRYENGKELECFYSIYCELIYSFFIELLKN